MIPFDLAIDLRMSDTFRVFVTHRFGFCGWEWIMVEVMDKI